MSSEDVQQLRNSRGGYASHVTRRYKEFVRSIEDGCPMSQVNEILVALTDSFGAFVLAHDRYIKAEPDSATSAEIHYHDLEELVKKARSMFTDMQQDNDLMKKEVSPDDSASQMGSGVSTTSSARAKAAAKRSALYAKLQSQRRQEEFENEMFLREQAQKDELRRMEADMERKKREDEQALRRLKMEADYEAAIAEEETLAQFMGSVVHSTPRVSEQRRDDRAEYSYNAQKDAGNMYKRESFANKNCARTDTGDYTNQHGQMKSHTILDPLAEEYRGRGTPKLMPQPNGVPVVNNVSGMSLDFELQRRLIDVMSLPKTSLKPFDGDPLNFWSFMHAFDHVVGRTTVDDGSKLNRLFEYCTGKAAKVIQSCVHMHPSDGYVKARQLLTQRFGNEYQISEAWVKKVTEGAVIKSNCGESLQELADDLRTCVETLRAMNMINEIDSRLRMVKILARVPGYLQGRWRKTAVENLEHYGRYPSIEQLLHFLDRAAREANDPVFGFFPEKSKESKDTKMRKEQTRPKGSSFHVKASDKPGPSGSANVEKEQNHQPKKCYLCSKEHSLNKCDKFQAMTAQEKLETLKKHRLCFNCMFGRHQSRWCKSESCDCGRKHSKVLHDVLGNTADAPKQDKATEVKDSQAKDDLNKDGVTKDGATKNGPTRGGMRSYAAVNPGGNQVSLPIVTVLVKSSERELTTHALLDPGSNRSFCTKSLMNDLGLKGTSTELSLETLNEGKDTKAVEISFDVTSRRKAKFIPLSKVLALEKFPDLSNCAASPSDLIKWRHLRGLTFPENIDVQLLIGQDHPQALMPLELRRGGDKEPYAVRTALGWTINGPVAQDETDLSDVSTLCAYTQVQLCSDTCLETQVERFWKVDGVPASGPAMSVEDKKVLDNWSQNVKLKDGHYELPIPFEDPSRPNLPNNRMIAERRLKSLGRRLSQDDALMRRYRTGIEDLVAKGYAELAKDEESSETLWYLPHHNVVNRNKPEKLRIVFDCAAEFRGASLNKTVLQGPNLTNALLGVLVRFRENKVAITGDIEAMFHQVRVWEPHRDVLRFLWWRNGEIGEVVDTYRMTCHLFGGVWSPSAAGYALRHTVDDNQKDFPPDVLSVVEENFYVDDCLLSLKDEETAVRIVSQLCQLLARGGFHITKWLSNSRGVISSIPVEERAKEIRSLDLDLGSSLPAERVLGVHWNAEKDCFGINIKPKEPVCTRRGLLSTMSSVYDPLGLISPYVLRAKLIFQAECRKQEKGWDDPLDADNQEKWLQWLEDLPKLQEVQLQRCIIPDGFGRIVQANLHHFCDASMEGYGAVSYLRAVNDEGKVHCCFMLAKAKLAPMKQLTIPRLELVGAVTAVKLDVALRQEMKLDLGQSVFWSDSTIVLQYLKNTSKRFQTFVANRVSMIQQDTKPTQWRHVNSELNPADDVSRGLGADEMKERRRWLEGPDFLWKSEEAWPRTPIGSSDLLASDPEVKKETRSCAVNASDADPESSLEKLLGRHSDWFKLQKTVVWLTRFKAYCCLKYLKKVPIEETSNLRGQITIQELRQATDDIVRCVQQQTFASDKQHQTANEVSIDCKQKLRSLNPIMEDGILKVGGRLDRAPVSYELRHPAILPSKHQITELLIRHHHRMLGHQGPVQVLSALRESFWIVKGRASVRRVLKDCLQCKRRNAQQGKQQMAPLPVERLVPDKPPFTYTGVDYFGPFLVKRGRSTVKRYGCIFTCLTTRAVHLEVAHTLELDSFLCALQRFISRRGRPETIFSDNGTNFHGGDRELRESLCAWNEQQLTSNMLQRNIEWRYNPPYASHMGGVWERLIRSTRRILKQLLHAQLVSDETLMTLMTEAEKILNDRPITNIGDDVTDPDPLTPSKLLLLKNNACLPLGTFQSHDRYTRRWWRQAQYLADVFWHRWVREYLPTLQERQKWTQVKRNFRVDDLVLVVDENLPRGQWPLGRILETYPDEKGQVRSVRVRIGDGMKKRPIHKLVWLENCQTWSTNQEEDPAESPAEERSIEDKEKTVKSARDVRARRLPKKFDGFVMD